MRFLTAITKSLADYLRSNVLGIQQVITEWPSSNIQLNMPSITITSRTSNFTNYPGYLVRQLPPIDNISRNMYVVGEYNITLQLDLWAANKEQRAEYYELVFAAINKGFLTAEQPMGLRINLVGYYNQLAEYLITDYGFEDSEISAQRQEWRAIITLESSCPAIIERDDFMITKPIELTLETEG